MPLGSKNYYLIHGDPLLMSVCEDNIIKEISQDHKVSRRHVEGKDLEDDVLINMFRAKGLGGKRILHISNPTTSQKDLILNAFSTIEKNKTLYIILSAEDIEKTSKFYKAFNKAGQAIECVSPYNEYGKQNADAVDFARSWTEENIESLGVKLDDHRDAIEVLLYRCKYNIGIVRRQLDKIKLYHNYAQRPVTSKEVMALCPNVAEISVFGLISSLESGHYDQTLLTLNALVRERDVHPESIFNSLLLKARTWILMKRYLDDGIRDANTIRDMIKQDAIEYGQEGITPPHPYVIKIACEVSKRMSMEQLVKLYDFLYEAQLMGRKKSFSTERRYQLLLEFIFMFYGLQTDPVLVP